MFTARENTLIAKARALTVAGLPIYVCLPGGIVINPYRS